MRAFIDADDGVAAATGNGHGGDFPLETAILGGRLRALHGFDGERILRFAREVVLAGALFGKRAHRAGIALFIAAVGVFQAIHHHVVIDHAMADTVAAARLRHQVRGVGHRFHAARHHHVGAAGQQGVMREHGRLHGRAAHFRQGHGARGIGQAGLAQCLARGRLALACHQAIAEIHVFNGVRRHAGPFDGGADGHGAQIAGGDVGKVALEGAHGGARGTDDYDWIIHVGSPVKGGEGDCIQKRRCCGYGKTSSIWPSSMRCLRACQYCAVSRSAWCCMK
ncbi:hypothetical protein D3C72_1127780 [compost metagenome]